MKVPGEHKPGAEMLRQALATGASGVDDCPDAEILAAYAERALDADETAHYELHFAQCANCRDQLAAMSRAAAPAPRPPRISWIWTWGWIALAPVTAVLLLAAVFVAKRPAAKVAKVASVEQQPPLVAMSRPSELAADSIARQSAPMNSTEALARRESIAPPVRRAKSAIPPNVESAPNKIPALSGAMSAESDLTQTPPSAQLDEKKRDGSSVSELPLASRNYTQLQKSSQAPAPQPAATPPPAQGLQNGAVVEPRAATQTVTVQSESAAAATAAPVPSTLADNSAGNVAGVAAAARNNSPSTFSRMASVGGQNEMVVVQAPLDRSARTIVPSPDPQVLWRVSGGRYVERSADAGATWHTQWTSATAHVVAGSAPSADTCWLVGSGGIVVLTTDGNKWHAIAPPEVDDFTSVSASDAKSATVTTKDGRQFKTRDGGKHWTPAP
jgi:hypothetical protein